MKHFKQSLIFLLILLASLSINTFMTAESTKTSQEESTASSSTAWDDAWDTAYDNDDDYEDEQTPLKLSLLQRAKEKFAELRLMTKLGYRALNKKYPNGVLTAKIAAATIAAFLLVKVAKKVKNKLS